MRLMDRAVKSYCRHWLKGESVENDTQVITFLNLLIQKSL